MQDIADRVKIVDEPLTAAVKLLWYITFAYPAVFVLTLVVVFMVKAEEYLMLKKILLCLDVLGGILFVSGIALSARLKYTVYISVGQIALMSFILGRLMGVVEPHFT